MKIISSTALLLFALSTVWIQRARAQSQDSQKQEIQQLKNKLQQLDQMMTEVKGEIRALEGTQVAPVAPAEEQGQAEGQKTSAPQEPLIAVPSEAIIAQPQAGTVPLEGEITERKDSVNFYGFVMLDSGYDFGQINPNWFDVVRPTQLPSFKNEFAPSGNVYASVRQTRFGVKSSTPTPYGDLNTIFEFELFGTGVDAGQTTFRLRHAYGELGQFGAGQTWSPFMDIGVFPNTVEYWGPSGMVFFRNVQVRWMPVRRKTGSVTLALERPGASGDQGVYADRIELINIRPRFNFPDLSGNARIDRNWGYLQMAGIVRKIGWVDTSGNPINLGGSVVGWGVNVTSNLNLSKNNVAKLAFVYGSGIENYMDDAPVDVGIQNNPPNSRVPIKGVALPVLGVVSFLDHTWNKHFTSSVGYSLVDIQNSNAQRPADFHQGDYAIANLLYHPIPRVMMGSEFQFGRRVNFSNGFNFNDYRVQFSFKFDWDKSFKSPTL
ncbi:MAG TPA: DcaP family trimeric outer membrane transporter [Terriglobales bacterium]|nr:DcaP family trimeric outer membrane transporter [Terriglobales bacterium]